MPVVFEGGADLLLALGFLVCFGLLYAERYTLSPLLRTLAAMFDAVAIPLIFTTIRPLAWVATGLRHMDYSIQHWLGQAVNATEVGMVYLFHSSVSAVEWTAHEIAGLAESTYAFGDHLMTRWIPHVVEAAVKRAERFAYREAARVERYVLGRVHALRLTVEHIAGDVRRIEHAITHVIEDELARLRVGIDRVRTDLTQAITRGIDDTRTWVEGQVTTVTGEIADVRSAVGSLAGRLSHIEGLLTGAAFATLVGAALASLGLDWIKCRNAGKVGNKLCGLDSALIDSLLGFAFAFLVVLDPEAIAEEALTVESGIEWLIRATVDA